jgi:accessory gene regulator B
MLDTITSRITDQIVLSIPGISPEKAEQIDYGLYMAISDLLKVSAVIIASVFFKLTFQAILALLVFGLLRMSMGGIHAKTQLGCILTYFTIIFGSIELSELITFPFTNLIVFPAGIIAAYLYAPADLPCKPIHSRKRRLILKTCGIAQIVVLFSISFFLPTVYRNIIVLNTFIVISMITPFAYKLTGNKTSNS